MSECWNCGEHNNEYEIGYFEGIRMVVMKAANQTHMEQHMQAKFIVWLNEELKEALILRDNP